MDKVTLLATAIAFSVLASPAMAKLMYANAPDGQEVAPFGAPDATNYGETFSVSAAEILSDWSFFATSGNAGEEQLVVAAWNGVSAVGPALYTSPLNSYAGGTQTLAFTGIGTSLSAGNYIAFLTVAGVPTPATYVNFATSEGDAGLGGQFVYANTDLGNPLTSPATWYNLSQATTPGVQQLQFSADFVSASPVPIPSAVWLMLGGLGGIGAVARKQRGQAPQLHGLGDLRRSDDIAFHQVRNGQRHAQHAVIGAGGQSETIKDLFEQP
jgi:hypothetical protein